MKNIINQSVLLLFFSISLCYAQNNNSIRTIWPQDDTLKQFFGTIGDIPVELFLKKHGGELDGFIDFIGTYDLSYYFKELQEHYNKYKNDTIYIKGKLFPFNRIEIRGYGIFNGYFGGDSITGTWTDLFKDSLRYPFYLISAETLSQNWKTYRDENLGIEFKYPNNAVIATDKGNFYYKKIYKKGWEFYPYREMYEGDTNLIRYFVDVQFPQDTNTNFSYIKFFISSWIENICCQSAIVIKKSDEEDTVYSKKIGSKYYLIQETHDPGMNQEHPLFAYSICRKNDNRCFVFNYSYDYCNLGVFDTPYSEGYYNYDYKKEGYDNVNGYYELNGPKPFNEKKEIAIIEHIIGSLKFIK